jgi:hypothetical protein
MVCHGVSELSFGGNGMQRMSHPLQSLSLLEFAGWVNAKSAGAAVQF